MTTKLALFFFVFAVDLCCMKWTDSRAYLQCLCLQPWLEFRPTRDLTDKKTDPDIIGKGARAVRRRWTDKRQSRYTLIDGEKETSEMGWLNHVMLYKKFIN